MDSKLLKLLLEGGEGFVSGERLSESLGVTRAAVWKEIIGKSSFASISALTSSGHSKLGLFVSL